MDTKRIEVDGRTYELHKIPAFAAQKIAFNCMNAIKSRDLTTIPDSTIATLLSYVGAVNAAGGVVMLSDEALVQVNVPDVGSLITIELEMLEYNFGFFFDGSLLTRLEGIVGRLAKSTEARVETAS